MSDEHDFPALLALHECSGTPRFATGFADRVMVRITGRRAQTVNMALERHARRVLPTLAAASLLLGVWNWWTVRDRAPSTFSAVLGVVPASVSVVRTAPSLGLTNTEAFE